MLKVQKRKDVKMNKIIILIIGCLFVHQQTPAYKQTQYIIQTHVIVAECFFLTLKKINI